MSEESYLAAINLSANLGNLLVAKDERIRELEKDNAAYIERIVRLTNRVSELEESVKWADSNINSFALPADAREFSAELRKKAGL
jgi:hypothetical protein